MQIVVSTHVKIHQSARDSFAAWSRMHSQSFAALKAELESSQGQPPGAIQSGSGRWMWASGGTFVSYVIKDKPVAVFGTTAALPFLANRYVIVTDIFAV